MSDVRIDRLTLRLSGLTEAEGRRLAELVAEDLAARDLPSGAASTVEAMRIDLRAEPRSSVDTLKEQIVGGLVRELSRTA